MGNAYCINHIGIKFKFKFIYKVKKNNKKKLHHSCGRSARWTKGARLICKHQIKDFWEFI